MQGDWDGCALLYVITPNQVRGSVNKVDDRMSSTPSLAVEDRYLPGRRNRGRFNFRACPDALGPLVWTPLSLRPTGTWLLAAHNVLLS